MTQILIIILCIILCIIIFVLIKIQIFYIIIITLQHKYDGM